MVVSAVILISLSLCFCVSAKVLQRCLGAWLRARTCQWLANQRHYREGRLTWPLRISLLLDSSSLVHPSILRSALFVCDILIGSNSLSVTCPLFVYHVGRCGLQALQQCASSRRQQEEARHHEAMATRTRLQVRALTVC